VFVLLGNFCGCSFKKIWLVGFRYMFGKNYDWDLCVAKNMYKMFGETQLKKHVKTVLPTQHNLYYRNCNCTIINFLSLNNVNKNTCF